MGITFLASFLLLSIIEVPEWQTIIECGFISSKVAYGLLWGSPRSLPGVPQLKGWRKGTGIKSWEPWYQERVRGDLKHRQHAWKTQGRCWLLPPRCPPWPPRSLSTLTPGYAACYLLYGPLWVKWCSHAFFFCSFMFVLLSLTSAGLETDQEPTLSYFCT